MRVPSLVIVLALAATASPALAFDPAQTFHKGAFVVSGEAGYGAQTNIDADQPTRTLEFANAGVRFSLLPFGTSGRGAVYGAFELGLEPFFQRYFEPVDASFGGLAAVVRYHFLALGRFVPYMELAGAAGGTDLNLPEIRSDFTFLLFAGAGASFFITDRTAVYAGYRLQHVSNAYTSRPNRGFESSGAVIGISYFLR